MLKVLLGATLALLPFAVLATPPLQDPSGDLPVFFEVSPGDGLAIPSMPPASPAVPAGGANLRQSPGADGIVTELHMSASPGGPPPFENKFPSSTTTVYAVFSYQAGDLGQPLRVEVVYHHLVTGTTPIFTHTAVYTGTSTASVAVPVAAAFPGQSQFPIGGYTTTLYSTPDGGQTWESATSAAWQVVIKPRDPYYENYQWNLNNTGQGGRRSDADVDAPEAWGITTGRNDVIIAVVGPGVYLGAHEDLQSKLWVNPGEVPDNGLDDDGNGYVDDVHGFDFTDEGRPEFPASHVGTFVAGIAAAATDNGVGIAGLSWGARVMSVKVLRRYPDGSVSGTPEDVIEGLTYAVNNGARVIITSFYVLEGANLEVIERLRRAMQYAHDQGVLVVTGAGDQGENSPVVFPSAFSEVMAVGETDGHDRWVKPSSCGFWVDVAAPAEGVISTRPCTAPYYCAWDEIPYGVTDYWSKQSVYAAAHVAGLATLVWSVNPDLTVDEVRQIIEGTADDLGPPGFDPCYGHGRINAQRALLATPHALTLTVPNSLTFLADDTSYVPSCYTITNPYTGALTWRVSTDVDWLKLHGPSGWTPSHLVVCPNVSALPEYGTYDAVVTATTTLTTNIRPFMTIPARVAYTPLIRRLYWPFFPLGEWRP